MSSTTLPLLKYGFSFSETDAGGLGALLHAMLLAAHYAKRIGAEFVLVREGMNVPRLNGAVDDLARTLGNREQHYWHTYFSSLSYAPRAECVGVWVQCPLGGGWNIDPPNTQDATTEERMHWYSNILCNEIFLLQPTIKAQIDEALARSVFNAETDYAVHVRRTDKMFNSSLIESAIVPLSVYVEETMQVMNKDRRENPHLATRLRVYLCTDDHEICGEMQQMFAAHNVLVVWDPENESAPRHIDRVGNRMTKSEAWRENLHALKLLHILARARHAVGGRMSYFYRIAELLRWPSGKHSTNVKDNDIYGQVPYVHPNTPLVRPAKIDPRNPPRKYA